jgi:hypothetical protein
MSKLATVQVGTQEDGTFSLKIQCLSADNTSDATDAAAAAAARTERLGRLGDASKPASSGGPALRPTSLRPGGPSLRPAGPLAPPSPKRAGPPDARGPGSTAPKLGSYQYTKQELIELGKRCVTATPILLVLGSVYACRAPRYLTARSMRAAARHRARRTLTRSSPSRLCRLARSRRPSPQRLKNLPRMPTSRPRAPASGSSSNQRLLKERASRWKARRSRYGRI